MNRACLGKAGEEDAQPQAQDKADSHRDQGVEQMHADASDQGLGVARQKFTHTVTPQSCSAMAEAMLVLVMMPPPVPPRPAPPDSWRRWR